VRRARASAALRLACVATLATAAGLVGCKDRRAPAADHGPGGAGSAARAPSDAAIDADLGACRTAAARVAALPRNQRAAALLDGCQPCGDWKPLLDWNTPAADGGPSRASIEKVLFACQAFCAADAKQRFLGTLDAARGQSIRGPWRQLGEVCRDKVSAIPDTRFMSAPYFALDRIARAIADPAVLDPIELPLPALGVNGVGFDLPDAPSVPPGSPGAAVDAGPAVLTVDGGQITAGTLPTARLSAGGVSVGGDYPGARIEPARLPAAIAAAPAGTGPIAMIAPRALPADRIARAIAAAGGAELRLAVGVPGPGGWILPAALPVALIARGAPGGMRIALDEPAAAAIAAIGGAAAADLSRAPPVITVAPGAKVDGLARAIAALAARGVGSVAVVAAPKP
jgi:hypothetical protein